MNNIASLKNLVSSLKSKLADGEKFFTAQLAVRLNKAASSHPEDSTIRSMANFLSERSKKSVLITRAELKEVYNKLYTTNTSCGDYLKAELGKSEEEIKREPMNPAPPEDLHEKYSDPVLANAMKGLFDKNAVYNPYSTRVAKIAEENCKRVLPGKPSIKTVAGNEDAIICEAIYETPKGRSHVLVPVEVRGGNALLPNSFVSKAGFTLLNEKNLADYVVKTAGMKIRADINQIFNVVKIAKHGYEEPTSEVEKIVNLAKLASGTPVSHDSNAILQQVDPEIPAEKSVPEAATFANKLSNSTGAAEFIFGKEITDAGRKMISKALFGFGYTNFQIKVASITSDSIVYAVALNDTGFKVPVKIDKSLPSYPTVILANGMPEEFNKEGIDKLSTVDRNARSLAYGFDLGNPGTLIEVVKEACTAGNFTRANDALSAIAESGDKQAYLFAFAIYHEALEGIKPKENKIKTIKLKNGTEVCAQTYLPVDKVWVDENGVAHAKYRKNMEHTDEFAGGFMNSKILMGL